MNILGWLAETNIQAAVIGPLLSGLCAIPTAIFRHKRNRKCRLADLIQEIEELGIKHWCSLGTDPNNHLRAIDIYSKLQTLGRRTNQKKEAVKTALIDYRQAITSGDFSELTRPAHPFEDPRILLIRDKAENIRKILNIKKHH